MSFIEELGRLSNHKYLDNLSKIEESSTYPPEGMGRCRAVKADPREYAVTHRGYSGLSKKGISNFDDLYIDYQFISKDNEVHKFKFRINDLIRNNLAYYDNTTDILWVLAYYSHKLICRGDGEPRARFTLEPTYIGYKSKESVNESNFIRSNEGFFITDFSNMRVLNIADLFAKYSDKRAGFVKNKIYYDLHIGNLAVVKSRKGFSTRVNSKYDELRWFTGIKTESELREEELIRKSQEALEERAKSKLKAKQEKDAKKKEAFIKAYEKASKVFDYLLNTPSLSEGSFGYYKEKDDTIYVLVDTYHGSIFKINKNAYEAYLFRNYDYTFCYDGKGYLVGDVSNGTIQGVDDLVEGNELCYAIGNKKYYKRMNSYSYDDSVSPKDDSYNGREGDVVDPSKLKSIPRNYINKNVLKYFKNSKTFGLIIALYLDYSKYGRLNNFLGSLELEQVTNFLVLYHYYISQRNINSEEIEYRLLDRIFYCYAISYFD